MLALHISLESARDYLVSRPWSKLIKFDLVDLSSQGGLFDCSIIKEMMAPLLLANDISLSITFQEAKSLFNVDLHIFATDLESFRSVDFNASTFPDMLIVTAAMLSSAITPLFTVGEYNGVNYIDGGFSNNFPLTDMLKSNSIVSNEVLSLNMICTSATYNNIDNLFDKFTYVFFKMLMAVSKYELNHETGTQCDHYISFASHSVLSKEIWDIFLYSEPKRALLVEKGVDLAKEHIARWRVKTANSTHGSQNSQNST
jgi:predicted acylesterase/phospholipase RssA